jgi:transcriptional regulator with XRE-family HTH domain
MAESLGARLRQQRERRRISLASIASETKISVLLLAGLERDDFAHWPYGIFGRAFVRAYAQAIGLDPDPIVKEFLELHPDPAEVGVGALAEESAAERPSMGLGGLVARAWSRRRQPPPPDPDTEPPGSTRIVAPPPAAAPPAPAAPPDFDLAAVAHVCTELGRVRDPRAAGPLVEAATRALGAVGLIVWIWDPLREMLAPTLAHGYADDLLAKLPPLRRDADNATAACFRSGESRTVAGTRVASGALVVPLLAPAGCVGTLSVELRDGGERKESVRAIAEIFAAQLATWAGPADAGSLSEGADGYETIAIAATS